MSLRQEYRDRFGIEEGDRLHDAVQGKINAGYDEATSAKWWRMVAHERAAGEVFVAELLDDFCRSITYHGVPLDPVEVWRRPRQAEIDDETRRRRWALEAFDRMALGILPPTRWMLGVNGA